MRIRQMAIWTLLGTSLWAQGSDSGFRWVGFRAGSISFDAQEGVSTSAFLGAQGGLVFDQQHYGISFEGLLAHPRNDLFPGKKLSHSEASVTFLSGLSGDPASGFWPYLGLGLGGISIPKIVPSTQLVQTTKGGTAHVALGMLHRPAQGFIWGVEGRYLLTFTPKDLREMQGSLLVGFTWGGRPVSPPPAVTTPPPEVKATPAPAEAPALAPPVEVVVAPPPPPHAAEVVPAPTPPPVQAPVPVPPPPPAMTRTPSPAPVPDHRRPSPPAPASTGSALIERLDALLLGDMAKSLELGRNRIQAIPAYHWTLRLEIANLPSTLKNAVVAFSPGKPDLFIAPIQLKGGRSAYQLFLGDYPSKAEAERAAKAVPAFFLEGGQRPRPFPGNGILAQATQ